MSNSLLKGERAIESFLRLTRGFSHYTRFCCNELVAVAVSLNLAMLMRKEKDDGISKMLMSRFLHNPG